MPTAKTSKTTRIAKPGTTGAAKSGTTRASTVRSGLARTRPAQPAGALGSRAVTRPDPTAQVGTANATAAGAGRKPSRPAPAAGRPRVRTIDLTDVVPAALVPPLPAAVEDTPAGRAVWAALNTQPGATTADLTTAAGVGRSTATRLLAGLADAGAAVRTPGGGVGRTRQPDRWAPTPAPASAPVSAPAGATDQDGNHASGPTAAVVPPGGKLAGGQLRDLVAAHLRAHPDQDLGPTAIAKHLDRSAGAVANACVRLIALGQATQTSHNPRRYRATTP